MAPLVHGGDLAWARRRFPAAPEPLLDLSTGINPHAYPLPPMPADAFTRLPSAEADARVRHLAATVYGAPDAAHVTLAPGTQILLPLLAGLVPPGRAAVLGPTYAEHARAARLAGHDVHDVTDAAALVEADLAVLVNPNNPDGRLLARAAVEDLLAARGGRGLMVVDEAFMDVAPDGVSVASLTSMPGLAVLRSFGKFYGLAGLRLGALAAVPATVARIAAQLGPWAVSGVALTIAEAALADQPWRTAMRERLAGEVRRLDALLTGAGLAPSGTDLFRMVESAQAPMLFERLGRAGLVVRCFEAMPQRLRFGLPPDDAAWARLAAALA
ncbi:threonine-phosphate decarboxylase CobD [Chelatococcus reniformis]|uniref:threonine-phosphate decarboxylase CobD n=1 Tax=Chelatococcus reniformis TaxID=1494448 RepID=UPI0027E46B63|nr:threonine-phosphate decarboxylase CobD [Chelatococcus reniformis]